ncbi:hypothetical protein BS50DRAFT_330499 [Corynespora cassiicola Philippines]|uniref:Uncharacterized protein n=1 Tax=Corynespora cassiicola Philippines TaxID=1448308 RepID=A0A2T2NV97_CORCC|nr:hypothetical protein BS50DRAFT_330499 [Corynespora cassiicola Philippines]
MGDLDRFRTVSPYHRTSKSPLALRLSRFTLQHWFLDVALRLFVFLVFFSGIPLWSFRVPKPGCQPDGGGRRSIKAVHRVNNIQGKH